MRPWLVSSLITTLPSRWTRRARQVEFELIASSLDPPAWSLAHIRLKTSSLKCPGDSYNETSGLRREKDDWVREESLFRIPVNLTWIVLAHRHPPLLQLAVAHFRPRHGLRTIWWTFIKQRHRIRRFWSNSIVFRSIVILMVSRVSTSLKAFFTA